MIITFGLTLIAWVFFRSDSVAAAFSYIQDIFSSSLFTIPRIKTNYIWVFIVMLLVFEWIFREKQHGLQLNQVKDTNSTKMVIIDGYLPGHFHLWRFQ